MNDRSRLRTIGRYTTVAASGLIWLYIATTVLIILIGG